MLAQQEPGKGCRGSARGRRDDEPGQSHRALGRVGRGTRRSQTDLRGAPRRKAPTSSSPTAAHRSRSAPTTRLARTSRSRATRRTSHGGRTSAAEWSRASTATSSTLRTRHSCSTKATCRSHRRPKQTFVSRSPPAASPRRSTRMAPPARAGRSGRRSSCSPTARARGACSPTPTSPEPPVTGSASGVTTSTAIVSGAVNPEGASVNVSFEFGTTTAYGQSDRRTEDRTEQLDDAVRRLADRPASRNHDPLSSRRSVGLRHLRRRRSDADDGVVAAAAAATTAQWERVAEPPKVSGTTARVRVSCTGPAGAKCRMAFKLTVTELFKGHKLISVTARTKVKKKVVVVGIASVTLNAGESRTVRIALNSTGRSCSQNGTSSRSHCASRKPSPTATPRPPCHKP